jgi:antitoxin CcdA
MVADVAMRAPGLALNRQQRENWIAENRDAIDAYNERVQTRGIFSDGARSF